MYVHIHPPMCVIEIDKVTLRESICVVSHLRLICLRKYSKPPSLLHTIQHSLPSICFVCPPWLLLWKHTLMFTGLHQISSLSDQRHWRYNAIWEKHLPPLCTKWMHYGCLLDLVYKCLQPCLPLIYSICDFSVCFCASYYTLFVPPLCGTNCNFSTNHFTPQTGD